MEKEKAIEVLKQYNLTIDLVSIKYRLQQSYSKLLVDYIKENEKESIGKYGIEFNASFSKRWAEIKDADMFLLCNYPTLDDAIAVVEDYKKSYDYTATTTVKQGFYHEDNVIRDTLERLLNALRGLKEGK